MSYSLKDICSILNIPSSTIRYYDNNHLLPFIKRNDLGERYIDEADLSGLTLLLQLKEAGYSLKDIRDIMQLREDIKYHEDDQYAYLEQIVEIARRHNTELLNKQQNLINQLKMNDFTTWYFTEALRAGNVFIFATDNAPQYKGDFPHLIAQDEESLKNMFEAYCEKYGMPKFIKDAIESDDH